MIDFVINYFLSKSSPRKSRIMRRKTRLPLFPAGGLPVVLAIMAVCLISCQKGDGYTIIYFPTILAAPVITPPGGTFHDIDPVTVEIYSDDQDADIRYTLDGSVPAKDTGNLYNDRIQIEDDTVLTAVAFKGYASESPATVAVYTFVPGRVIINFSVDDTANQTYTSGELVWFGSLAYDAETNYIEFEPTWTGPHPTLWDDGPLSLGGHEPAGSVAGDNIWSISAFFEIPESDVAFEYGLRDSQNNWLWQGANGSFTVPAGSGGLVINTEGFAIPDFGDIDLKLEFDSYFIDEMFSFDPVNDTVSVKLETTFYEEVEFFDDGIGEDAFADDGIYTFVLGDNVGGGTDFPHRGLLHAGETEEFVLVISGIEYKLVFALDGGITAYTREPLGVWEAAAISAVSEFLAITAPVP